MGRLANWRGQEFLASIGKAGEAMANALMDEVVRDAKMNCPVGFIRREGKWSGPGVASFTPKTGKNKGKTVAFKYERVWQGREPGDLQRTIRRVNRPGATSVRVYAGSYKVNWAMLVEKGSHNFAKRPFLRPAFERMKAKITGRINLDKVVYGLDPKTGFLGYIHASRLG